MFNNVHQCSTMFNHVQKRNFYVPDILFQFRKSNQVQDQDVAKKLVQAQFYGQKFLVNIERERPRKDGERERE